MKLVAHGQTLAAIHGNREEFDDEDALHLIHSMAGHFPFIRMTSTAEVSCDGEVGEKRRRTIADGAPPRLSAAAGWSPAYGAGALDAASGQ